MEWLFFTKPLSVAASERWFIAFFLRCTTKAVNKNIYKLCYGHDRESMYRFSQFSGNLILVTFSLFKVVSYILCVQFSFQIDTLKRKYRYFFEDEKDGNGKHVCYRSRAGGFITLNQVDRETQYL